MTTTKDLHRKWLNDPAYREEYESLNDEFALAQAMIAARSKAGLTQEDLAARMHTKQSVIARWESGTAKPSTRTLEQFAQATGTHLRISFEPS
jgi:ribosome-binding protein aMBF1 (putative translation factor)